MLNKNEIDKRQTFKEIVSGFPFAKKQKNFVQSIQLENGLVTDKDVDDYQKSINMLQREKPLIKIGRSKAKSNRQTLTVDRSSKKGNKIVNDSSQIEIVDQKQNQKGAQKDSASKAVYISSRISK